MADFEPVPEPRKLEPYDPTQPLQLIKEEDDNVWQEEVVEPKIQSKRLSVDSHYDDDGGSPLERLVKSISGEDEVWPIADESSKDKQSIRGVKTYYDPTKNKKRGEFDSTDEINTPTREEKMDVITTTEQTPISVALYRFIFGRKKENTVDSPTQNIAEQAAGDDDIERPRSVSPTEEKIEENEETDVEKNDSMPEKIPRAIQHDLPEMRKEVAVNLPVLLLHKIKKVFTPQQKPAPLTYCPVCGQNLSGISYDDFQDNLRKAKLWRMTWVDPNAEIIPTPSQKIYKTELKIDAHGNRSLTEAFYRSVADKKRYSAEI